MSATLPSGTNQTPSGYSSARLAATCSARRVLPVPPGPVSVSSRGSSRSARDLVELALAPHERRQLRRQVVGPRVERADRREVGGQAVDHELRDPLRPQVLEPVGAERPEGQARPAAGRRPATRSPRTAAPGRRGRPRRRAPRGGRRGRRRRRRRRARLRPCGGPSGPGSRRRRATARPPAPAACRRRPRSPPRGRRTTAKNPSPSTWFSNPPCADQRVPDDLAMAGEQRAPGRRAERRRRGASSPRCR